MNTFEYLQSLFDKRALSELLNCIYELDDKDKTEEILELQRQAVSLIDKNLMNNKSLMYAYVLLKEQTDIETFLSILAKDLNTKIEYKKDGENYFIQVDDTILTIAFHNEKVQDRKIYDVSALNFNFDNYEEVLDSHQAYITISTVFKASTQENILNNNKDIIDRAKSFIKTVKSACSLNAVAVNISGYTFEKDEYIKLSEKTYTNDLPIFNIIPLIIYKTNDNSFNIYTFSMSIFGMHDIEVVNYKGDIQKLINIIIALLNKIIGESFNLDGLNEIEIEGQKIAISKSMGVSLPATTYKLNI